MKDKVKAILFKPETGVATKVLLGKDDKGSLLPAIYSIMGVDLVEHTYVLDDLGAYVDEEGLLKDKHLYGVLYTNWEGNTLRALAGNILFVNHDDQGNTIDLTEDQVERIEALKVYPVQYEDGRRAKTIVIEQEPFVS